MPSRAFLRRVPGDELRADVPAQQIPVRVQHEDAVVLHIVHDQPEALVALAQRGFGAPALADIADDRHHGRGAMRPRGAEADLDRELAPVLAPPDELKPASHRPQRRRLRITALVAGVRVAEPLRYQEADGLADEFFSLVTEQPQRLAVDQHDTGVVVDFDDAVRGGLDECAIARAGLLRRGARRPLAGQRACARKSALAPIRLVARHPVVCQYHRIQRSAARAVTSWPRAAVPGEAAKRPRSRGDSARGGCPNGRYFETRRVPSAGLLIQRPQVRTLPGLREHVYESAPTVRNHWIPPGTGPDGFGRNSCRSRGTCRRA